MTRTLVIACGGPRVAVALVEDAALLADRHADNARALPSLAEAVLAEAGPASFDLVAVTVGPGSFTGLRTGIALAHGLAAARSVKLVAVATAEALATPGAPTLAAFDTGRGSRLHVQLVGPDGQAQPPSAIEEAELVGKPWPRGLVVAGPAASRACARLLAGGHDVALSDARDPPALVIAAVACRRQHGTLPPLAPLPLYVDPAEAKVAAGLRPPPA